MTRAIKSYYDSNNIYDFEYAVPTTPLFELKDRPSVSAAVHCITCHTRSVSLNAIPVSFHQHITYCMDW